MRILLLHNEYFFPGGEDVVFQTEAAMLEMAGHEVRTYCVSNVKMSALSLGGKLTFFAKEAFFSREVYRQVSSLLKDFAPDVVHIHNPFYSLGPAAYEACFDAHVPVVQTLHNFRFVCLAATFFRAGHCCELCNRNDRWPGVWRGCWKGPLGSLWLKFLLDEYDRRRILERISGFICLSNFSRLKLADKGFPIEKMYMKTNALKEAVVPAGSKRGHVLFVGAFQSYKGIQVLLDAWARSSRSVPLLLVGDGPLLTSLQSRKIPGVQFLGRRSGEEVIRLMSSARWLIVPSECYENFPMVIAEAFACQTPVMASRIGSLPEIVGDGQEGVLFSPGDPSSLARVLDRFMMDDDQVRILGMNARKKYDREYTLHRSAARLLEIYQQILE